MLIISISEDSMQYGRGVVNLPCTKFMGFKKKERYMYIHPYLFILIIQGFVKNL